MKDTSLIENGNNPSVPTINVDTFPVWQMKLLCKVARYYNGKLYRFELINDNLSLKPVEESESKAIVLIVSRDFYKEQAKRFPIDNKAELIKILALQFPRENNFHTHNWGGDNGQSQVNIWQFNNKLPKATIYLPESLIIALSVRKQQIVTLSKHENIKSNNQIFIGRLDDLVHSVASSSVINSSQRFAMSVGMAEVEENTVLSFDNLAKQFLLGVKKLSLPLISTFINHPKKSNNLQLLKNISVPCLLVLSIYLALSSSYLVFKKYNLQQKLTQNSSEVSKALEVQQSLDNQQLRYSALQSFLKNQGNRSPLWLVLADIFPKAQFTNIRMENSRYVLRGSAEKATTILELLSKDQMVINAKFDFPTRKNRNRDTFVISFQLSGVVEEKTEISNGEDNG